MQRTEEKHCLYGGNPTIKDQKAEIRPAPKKRPASQLLSPAHAAQATPASGEFIRPAHRLSGPEELSRCWISWRSSLLDACVAIPAPSADCRHRGRRPMQRPGAPRLAGDRAPDHPVPRAALILLAPAREAMSQRPYRRPPERGRGRKLTSQQQGRARKKKSPRKGARSIASFMQISRQTSRLQRTARRTGRSNPGRSWCQVSLLKRSSGWCPSSGSRSTISRGSRT
jgi:hypothetical protein